MSSISRYKVFCKVVELGSFTAVANEIGYSQSAVSQIVKGIETELGTRLIERSKDGVHLTEDGRQMLPYIQGISSAEDDLARRQREMQGLTNSRIKILTFTSISRNLLPGLMKSFKQQYPGVSFLLKQGDYKTVVKEILAGSVDFGFMSMAARIPPDMGHQVMYEDGMVAVLPKGHPLCRKKVISLSELAKEPFILLDEGEDYNTVVDAFQRYDLSPDVQYVVYDDYTILSMIRQGFGVSILFNKVVEGFEEGVELREIREDLSRTIVMVWKNWDTMPIAARRFAEHIIAHMDEFL